MEEFDFYYDEKVTQWVRTKCTVESETEEEAIEKIKEAHKKNDFNQFIYDFEIIDDTMEYLSKEHNNGEPVFELYFENNDEPLIQD